MTNITARIDECKLSQLDKLDVLIAAAQRARIAAEHGLLFADRRGLALVNAMFDLTDCDDLYDLAQQVAIECGDYREAAE